MKFSIITVNKNNEKGLGKTCLSVCAQTYKDFEWIIIDGASTDGSVDIIKEYSGKTAFWVSEQDTGIYNAMNKGIKAAKGEYCLFLNSGDWIMHPWTLTDAANEIQYIGKPADIFYSDGVNNNYNIWKVPNKVSVDFLIRGTIQHQNCLIKKELFNHALYNEKYKIVSDWLFFLTEKINHDIVFTRINTRIAIFDNVGISTLNRKKNLTERKNAIRELCLPRKMIFVNKTVPLMLKFLKLGKYVLPYGIYTILSRLKAKITKHS